MREKGHRLFVAEDIKVRDAGFVPMEDTGGRSRHQRPRGQDDSRTLIKQGGDDIDAIEGFDFRDGT